MRQEIRVSYAARGQDRLSRIKFSYWANGTERTPVDNVLKEEIPAPVAGASITTVSLPDYLERLYYVGSDRFIQESSWNPSTQLWSTPGAIGTTARPHLASPLGVTLVGEEIWLFWFTDDKQLQYATSTYTASTWSAGESCLCLYAIPGALAL